MELRLSCTDPSIFIHSFIMHAFIDSFIHSLPMRRLLKLRCERSMVMSGSCVCPTSRNGTEMFSSGIRKHQNDSTRPSWEETNSKHTWNQITHPWVRAKNLTLLCLWWISMFDALNYDEVLDSIGFDWQWHISSSWHMSFGTTWGLSAPCSPHDGPMNLGHCLLASVTSIFLPLRISPSGCRHLKSGSFFALASSLLIHMKL